MHKEMLNRGFGQPFVVFLVGGLLLAPGAWNASVYWYGTLDGSPERSSTTRPAMQQAAPIAGYAPSVTRKTAASTNRDAPYKFDAGVASIPNVAEAANCGRASWYALYSRTASGERMNPAKLTAAHKTLRFGTKLKVTNTTNGRSVVVRINDRGPFVRGRVLDLSKAAASQIGMIRAGHVEVCFQQVPSRSVGRPICSTAPGCGRA